MDFKEYVDQQAKTETLGMFAETELALLGEAGEIIDEIKKHLFHEKKDKTDLIEEIGDFFWYLTEFSKEVNAAPYFEQIVVAMLTDTVIEDEETAKVTTQIRASIQEHIEKTHYRDIIREFYKHVFNLTNFREAGKLLLGFKDGVPYPAYKGLTNNQSEELQNVVFSLAVIIKRYAKVPFGEILDDNIKKTHARYKNRLGE